MHLSLSAGALTSLVGHGLPISELLTSPGDEFEDLRVIEEPGKFASIYGPSDKADDFLLTIKMQSDTRPFHYLLGEQSAFDRLRMFADIMATAPYIVPVSWNQYKVNDLISFFPNWEERSKRRMRFAFKIRPGGANAAFGLVLPDPSVRLETLQLKEEPYAQARTHWLSNLANGRPESRDTSLGDSTTVHLQRAGATRSHGTATYSTWLERLTREQADVLDHDLSHAVKIRGPGGTGKTLTLEMKALREVLEARSRGAQISVAYITHSWALADQVDDDIRTISEFGMPPEIDVAPLLALAVELKPGGAGGAEVLGDDSLMSKQISLRHIEGLIEEFRLSDWATYRDSTSVVTRERFESVAPDDVRALAWDLLVEFGCVLGADGIFPRADAERRYTSLVRAHWMMDLPTVADRRVVFRLYTKYFELLESQNQLTSDQFMVDLIDYLEGHVWNLRRKLEGYDVVMVDEFHLFNTLERMALRSLTKDARQNPKLVMALDPGQSAWGLFDGGEGDALPNTRPNPESEVSPGAREIVLPTVHRYTPQILGFVKQIDHHLPNLDLPDDWRHIQQGLESTASDGPDPVIHIAAGRAQEYKSVYERLRDLSASLTSRQIALAIIDPDRFDAYSNIADGLSNRSTKFSVVKLQSRSDAAFIANRRRGLVIAPADYLSGLQFDTVLVAGVPDLSDGGTKYYARKRFSFSMLYLAVTRAERSVEVFINDDDGGLSPVFRSTVDANLATLLRPTYI